MRDTYNTKISIYVIVSGKLLDRDQDKKPQISAIFFFVSNTRGTFYLAKIGKIFVNYLT